MPTYGVAYSFSRGLYDASAPGKFRVNPTIDAGDFTISKDGGAFVALTTLPVVSPAGSRLVVFQLSATEMSATRLTILGVDQAGGEWTDFMEHIEPETLPNIQLPVAVADAVLVRDWTAIASTPPAFSVWNALRFLRNAWALTPGTPAVLHVKTENGVTDAWTHQVTTDTTAQPITGVS